MVDLKELGARIGALEDECRNLRAIEEIRQLKYRYWRFVHNGDYERVADCFSADAIFDHGAGVPLRGRVKIGQFFKERVIPATKLVVLHGHNPEIEITGKDTAKGTWQLDNIRVDSGTNKAVRLGNRYDEEYVREEGEWRITSSRVAYLFVQSVEMEESSRFPTGQK